MKNKEFKQKYFTNNFYWVTENNHIELQNIGIKLGCVNPLGNKSIIKWHNGFKNLGFRTYAKNNNITKFQKEAFLVHNELATDYKEMITAYKSL